MGLPFLKLEELVEELKSKNLYTSNIQKALNQAFNSHKDQKRTNSKPYLEEHIYPVTYELLSLNDTEHLNENLIIGSLLHDSLEDDEDFTESIMVAEFGDNILNIVKPITKSASDNSHIHTQAEKYHINSKYLKNLDSAPFETKLIKLSDRYNNLCCCMGILHSHPEKAQRYIKESKDLFLPFAKTHSVYFYKKLSKALKKYSKLGL